MCVIDERIYVVRYYLVFKLYCAVSWKVIFLCQKYAAPILSSKCYDVAIFYLLLKEVSGTIFNSLQLVFLGA
jgi:hypothetical protein